jgi:hypothetical protein
MENKTQETTAPKNDGCFSALLIIASIGLLVMSLIALI